MSDTGWSQLTSESSERPLGAMDAARMAWRLLRSDFWRLWLLVLVVNAILFGAGLVTQCAGMVPLVGGLISTALMMGIYVFGSPPLQAGLFYAIRRKIDGGEAKVDSLFEGFKQRYWESVVAELPFLGIWVAVWGIFIVAIFVGVFVFGWRASGDGPGPFAHGLTPAWITGIVVAGVVFLAVLAAGAIFSLFFIFALLAVWDFPGRYGRSIVTSMRLVRQHFWSVLGLVLLMLVAGLAVAIVAAIPGGALALAGGLAERNWKDMPMTFLVALGVGVIIFYALSFLAMAGVTAWYKAAVIYLYRSWMGRPPAQGA
ncbi:MAG: DUF624 domain-containing protein [Planctomycetota bacterium]|nr:DUF624 domain-containing protein [Planctomycetota bacterium]